MRRSGSSSGSDRHGLLKVCGVGGGSFWSRFWSRRTEPGPGLLAVSLLASGNMSGSEPRTEFLYNLPPRVSWSFCRVMDTLSDLDWTRFASEVLGDQTAVRLAERRERRTDWVMNQWENRNGRVGELVDLLERLQLLRPRDVILSWASSLKPSAQPPPPLLPPPPPPPPPVTQLDPPLHQSDTTSTSSTCQLSTTVDEPALPRPAPPPPDSDDDEDDDDDVGPQAPSLGLDCSGGGVMCWSYEEVHAGTEGFSSSLQVGEGGFGVVYRATLRKTPCAVKRLRQDCVLDWTRVKESFRTEVDQLTRFRHPNIVDLLGFSEGPGPGSFCLIYSYMDNRSLEDQLHQDHVFLSWSHRVSIVEGASTALQFLHSPPGGDRPLIHGDVKSSNILLDRHLVAKLADFGLARFAPRGSPVHTTSVGQTETVRGTLAYLPDEYVRNGQLGTAVDVYSFGVVLLEVLTGRRALEKDKESGEKYLKDLVEEVEESLTGSSAATWRKHLDQRLIPGGAAEPAGSMKMVALACKCLDRKRKKRPAMTKVFDKLQDIHIMVKNTSTSSPLHHLPHPRPPLVSSVGALSQQLSKLGPLEDTYQSSQSSQSTLSSLSSQSSSSSSSFCSLPCPNPLLSSSSLPPGSSSLPPGSSSLSPSSFAGPCETDESRGFSQYDLQSQFRSNGASCRDQYHSQTGPADSQYSQPSVPTEDQYNFPPQSSSTSDSTGATGASTGLDTTGASAGLHGAAASLSPVGSLRSLSPGPSVEVNPSKQRFLQKKTLYEEGRIQTPELLSAEDAGRSRVEFRGPEESDELDYLPAKHD